MTKFNREQQRALAEWAIACAGRVLPRFESVRPNDARPRAALAALRAWRRTGLFSMKAIRGASLAAHAAARDVLASVAPDAPAALAARAAGQAVATAHVAEHALAAAYYALKAVAAAHPAKAGAMIDREITWQLKQLPEALRPVWQAWLATRLPKKTKDQWQKYLAAKDSTS